MDSDIQSEQFNEVGILAEAQEVGKVPRVVLVSLNGREFAAAVNIAVDATSNVRQLSNAAERVLVTITS